MEKQMLSVRIDVNVYQQLRNEIGKGKISGFVERAVVKELGDYDGKLEREKKQFQRKLIADYQRSAHSKALKKEGKIWEEAISDWLDEK